MIRTKSGESQLKLNKKAQLTVFIIIAFLIVIIILIAFLNKENIFSRFITEPVSEKIDKCLKDSADDALVKIRIQGGAINPLNYFLYEGNKIDYLCYNQEYYKPCIMQKPILMNSIKEEMKNYISERTDLCLVKLKKDYESSGYIVSYDAPLINIEILPKRIIATLESEFKITKDNTDSYSSIKSVIESEMYDMIMIASSISNWEARYGDSETMMFMRYYPNLKVEKKKQSEGTKIYTLTNRKTNEKFAFAIRSMVYPPGITGE